MKKSLAIMILGAALVWGCTMWVHSARAEDAVGPKWKLLITVTDPAGDHVLPVGSKEDGVKWFATRNECEAYRKDVMAPKIKELRAQIKKVKAPVTVNDGACTTDDSI